MCLPTVPVAVPVAVPVVVPMAVPVVVPVAVPVRALAAPLCGEPVCSRCAPRGCGRRLREPPWPAMR